MLLCRGGAGGELGKQGRELLPRVGLENECEGR